jgi:hypothetical protein
MYREGDPQDCGTQGTVHAVTLSRGRSSAIAALIKPYPRRQRRGRGDIVYQQACKRGCEGIVSKQLGSLYRSGRSRHWLKVKNPAAPAVRREAEEDWGANDGRHHAHQAAFDVPLCSR